MVHTASFVAYYQDQFDGQHPDQVIPEAYAMSINASAPPAPPKLTHRHEWTVGTHEDGYLQGLEELVRLWNSDGLAQSMDLKRISE